VPTSRARRKPDAADAATWEIVSDQAAPAGDLVPLARLLLAEARRRRLPKPNEPVEEVDRGG